MLKPIRLCFLLTLVVSVHICFAGMPETAQTDIYFPHLANGGPAYAQWQSRFTFINPNATAATVTMYLFGDSGAALSLDFGSGPTSAPTFTVPPNGTYVLQSQIGPVTTTGWAYASATLPVEATVAFRLIHNGTAQLEITAAPTLPSFGYRSVATPLVGIAVANQYTGSPLPVTVAVYDGAGNSLGQGALTIPPLGHTSFNLFQVIPGLPVSFTGNVLITPQNQNNVLIAWVVYSDSSGVISSLPEGRIGFPTPHDDQIQTVFVRLVNAYQTLLSDFGAAPQLVMSPESDNNAINAFAASSSTVQINLALAELINDSPSELAFVVAHEMGHIYQQRTGKFIWNPDREWDADSWGLLMPFAAGYDPYAGAGALGKLAMATGTANLGIQQWEDVMLAVDAHGSFGTRIDNLTTFIETVCGYSATTTASCSAYKAAVHPHFPALPTTPLAKPGTGK